MESIQSYVCIPVEIQFEGPCGPDEKMGSDSPQQTSWERTHKVHESQRAVKPGHLDLASLAFAKVISKLGTGLSTLTWGYGNHFRCETEPTCHLLICSLLEEEFYSVVGYWRECFCSICVKGREHFANYSKVHKPKKPCKQPNMVFNTHFSEDVKSHTFRIFQATICLGSSKTLVLNNYWRWQDSFLQALEASSLGRPTLCPWPTAAPAPLLECFMWVQGEL